MRNIYNIFLPSAMPAKTFIFLSFLVLCSFMVLAATALSAQDSEEGSEPALPESGHSFVIRASIGFGYGISADMARQAAFYALRMQAAERLALNLAKNGELRRMLVFKEESSNDDSYREDLTVLSHAWFALVAHAGAGATAGAGRQGKIFSRSDAHAPRGILRFARGMPFPALTEAREAYVWLFGSALMLEHYKLAIRMEKDLYNRYAGAAREYLQSAGASADGLATAQTSLKSLQAVQIYFELLPQLYADNFSGASAQTILARLEEASALMPDNYLLLAEIARLYAWLGQIDKAVETINAAILVNPDFAQSYSHRGALLLLLQKHSLALADLSRAIRLSGGKAEYYHDRAVAWRAMGDKEAMCDDLRASCLAGECQAHEWAVAGGECD
jgi:tetratricopeptide (TPR) repeat protein